MSHVVLRSATFKRDTCEIGVWNVKFSDFARRLKNIVSGVETGKGGDFAKELFQNILQIDDEEIDLDEVNSPSTYRAYFRGDRDITRFAQKIRKYVEPELFYSYIDGMGDDIQHDIFKEFAADCPGMTEQNVPEKMAELFKQIIIDACPVEKNKTAAKKLAITQPVQDTDFVLLQECGNKCPLCKAKLTEIRKGVPVPKYIKINILAPELDATERAEFEKVETPPDDLYSLDNQSLLCLKCATDYQINTTPAEYAELLRKKKQLAMAYQLETEAYDINVEFGINKILDALSNLQTIPQKEDKTKWTAFRVDRKIPDNIILQDTVTDFVLKYYRYIEKQYKQREREGRLRFNKVKNEISQCFELYDEAELSQREIFDRIVAWLKEKTNCDSDVACMAMVSFFVQNCEVFRDEAAE